MRSLLPGYKQQGRHLAAKEPEDDRREIVIDGADFSDLAGFYSEVSRLLGSPDGKPIRGLDAFNDLLRGGFGDIPAGEKLRIVWKNADKSRADLGYEAAAAYYRRVLERCRPENRAKVQNRLDRALAGEGPTLFDTLCAVINRTDSGHDCVLDLE